MLGKRNFSLLLLITALVSGGCAAIQPPGTGGPKAGPPYPVVLTAQPERREATALALKRLVQDSGSPDQLATYLQPVTASIKNLPKSGSSVLLLPKVGTNPEMSEEETREALRRFISDWRGLIGANPTHLSLIDRVDQPDGIKLAKYEQRPFRFPLRGGYGILEIRFLTNRKLVDLSSTCIPDVERLQSSLALITPVVTAEEAVKYVRANNVAYKDLAGTQQSLHVTSLNEVNAIQLVTYVLASQGQTDLLELHLAWEVAVTQAPFKTVYVDALDGKFIDGSATP
ncbi:MAG: hypothetical protein ABI967_08040 [bacterium]